MLEDGIKKNKTNYKIQYLVNSMLKDKIKKKTKFKIL